MTTKQAIAPCFGDGSDGDIDLRNGDVDLTAETDEVIIKNYKEVILDDKHSFKLPKDSKGMILNIQGDLDLTKGVAQIITGG